MVSEHSRDFRHEIISLFSHFPVDSASFYLSRVHKYQHDLLEQNLQPLKREVVLFSISIRPSFLFQCFSFLFHAIVCDYRKIRYRCLHPRAEKGALYLTAVFKIRTRAPASLRSALMVAARIHPFHVSPCSLFLLFFLILPLHTRACISIQVDQRDQAFFFALCLLLPLCLPSALSLSLSLRNFPAFFLFTRLSISFSIFA